MPIRSRPSTTNGSMTMKKQTSIVTLLFALFLLLTVCAPQSSSQVFVNAFQPDFKTSYRGFGFGASSSSTSTTALGVISAGWWRRDNRRKVTFPWQQRPKQPNQNQWDDLQKRTTASTTPTLSFPVMKCECPHTDIHLVDLPWLKPHEEVVSEKHVDDLLQATLGWGAYISPLLVDRTTGAILDGHHRYHVGKRLGLTRVPAVLVDYMGDHEITVDVWDGCGLQSLTKHQVLAMSLSPHVFPPKTSKHSFSDSLPTIKVPLKTLKM